ncbi:MAG: glucose 1-dehydrogenase [Acidimicrobiia bacterium]|nr:glucose 1-dehydrogenase [Acidimicrobiia bacterium]
MSPAEQELAGRVVLVTGAARGQGRAIAERLVGAGASVIAGDVLDAVDDLAVELGDRVHAAHLDVTDESSWERFVAAGIERFGGIDALVNNAGILRRVPIERETAAELERVWRVNTLGPFLGMQAVLPHLRARGGGTIVNTTSTASLGTHPGFGAYSASKAALRSLTKVAALELAAEGVRVNAVVPGPVLTPMVVGDDDPIAAERLAATPLGRAGLPADIAELVLFLVSDRSSFMTGAELVIDGGQTLGPALRRPDVRGS